MNIPNYHHKAFIQQLKDPDVEVHNESQDELQKSNRREGGGNIRAKEVKIMRKKSTETVEPSSWKLRNSRLTAVEPPWVQTRPSMIGRKY